MTSAKATSMADLLAKHKTTFITVHKGEIVKGKVTKLTSSEILLDINAKTEAVVMEKERKLLKALLSTIKVGDTVDAQVLNPESDMGQTVVSLRRFMDEKMWEQLQQIQKNQQKLSVHIKAQTKGGYLVELPQGLDGFLPNSHISFSQDKQDLVGQTLSVMIAELNKETRKIILSQKPVLGQADFDELVESLSVGKKLEAIVSHITTFGMFVSIPMKTKKDEDTFLDGFVHISEISWEKVHDVSEHFAVGDSVEAVVLKIDKANKRLDLSIKQLTQDPFEAVIKEFPLDKKVTGIIGKTTDTGLEVDLGIEEGIDACIRKEKIPPTVTYEEGQKVNLTVSEIDNKKHRIYLTPVLLEKPLTYR